MIDSSNVFLLGKKLAEWSSILMIDFFFISPFVSSRLNFSTNSSNWQITHDVKHSEAL